MMANNTKEIADNLIAAFSTENAKDWCKTRGVRVWCFTGSFLNAQSGDALVALIREIAPADARIFAMDDAVFRMRAGAVGCGSDMYTLALTSAEFPLIEEGGSFPLVETVFYSEKPAGARKESEQTKIYAHTLFGEQIDTHEFIINKATHTIEIPKDRETEDRMVIVVRPKG